MIELTDQQKKAAELLALGNKRVMVADAVGVNRGTINRWERLPEFVLEKTSLQAMARVEAVDRLRDMSSLAISKLRELLNDPETPANVTATICFRLLALNFSEGAIATLPVTDTEAKADFTPEKIAFVRENVYGIFAPGED